MSAPCGVPGCKFSKFTPDGNKSFKCLFWKNLSRIKTAAISHTLEENDQLSSVALEEKINIRHSYDAVSEKIESSVFFDELLDFNSKRDILTSNSFLDSEEIRDIGKLTSSVQVLTTPNCFDNSASLQFQKLNSVLKENFSLISTSLVNLNLKVTQLQQEVSSLKKENDFLKSKCTPDNLDIQQVNFNGGQASSPDSSTESLVLVDDKIKFQDFSKSSFTSNDKSSSFSYFTSDLAFGPGKFKNTKFKDSNTNNPSIKCDVSENQIMLFNYKNSLGPHLDKFNDIMEYSKYIKRINDLDFGDFSFLIVKDYGFTSFLKEYYPKVFDFSNYRIKVNVFSDRNKIHVLDEYEKIPSIRRTSENYLIIKESSDFNLFKDYSSKIVPLNNFIEFFILARFENDSHYVFSLQ